MRSVLYRFPDLAEFEGAMRTAGIEAELRLPSGEDVDDGEWVLAIFELGPARRATSAAGRGAASPEGARLVLEPRDVKRLVDFARREGWPAPVEAAPETARSAEIPGGAVPGVHPPTGRPSSPGSSPRVLIVDDDPDIRDVVSAMLEAVGLAVVTAESGEEAFDRVAREAFDLLVLDWNLPRMTGLELCRALRRQPGLASLPVLFLTANASSQEHG